MKRRTLAIIIALLLIAAGIALLLIHVLPSLMRPDVTETAEKFVHLTETPVPEGNSEEPKEAELTEIPEEEYVSPVDFEGLWEYNTDIYAWLMIPGTEISSPLVQSKEDDRFYLNHDWTKAHYDGGNLFTESQYNDDCFGNPVTVVYGHNIQGGEMFGSLCSLYSGADCLEKYPEIVVYLPEREIHFKVFAATSYSDRHILYNYDFTDEFVRDYFFTELLNTRTLDAVIDSDFTVGNDGQYIILSTCTGAGSKRFLVVGQAE